MNYKKLLIHIALALPLWGLGACSVNVPPPDLYSDPDAISTTESARSLLTSCYLLYPHYEYELSLLAGDFCPTSLSGKDVEQQNLYNWQDKEISKLATDLWLAYYNCIANCDVLLERLPNVQTDQPEQLNIIAAEAKTLKALCYFQLLRLYAPAYRADADGVILKSVVGLEFPPRSSIADCTHYIRTLLTEAAAVENPPRQNGWLSQRAAICLLAELELYAGHYEEALTHAQQLLHEMPAGALSATNYSRLWETNTYEGRIFAFNTSTPYYATIEYDAQKGDYFALNPALLLSPTDARKDINEYPMDMDGATRTLLGKYNLRNKKGLTNTYIDQTRYASALYIAAEAQARTGKENEARQLVNDYLNNLGATPIADTVSGEELTQAILHEKEKDFAGEGRNWFDLKRTASPLPRLKRWGTATSTTISPDDYRWTFPIPSSEYKYNESVTQNPGWPLNR